MAKYNLCYKDGFDVKVVELSALPYFKNKDATKIEEIDQFTSLLIDKDMLLKYLKIKELVNEDTNNLFITIEKKDHFIKQINIFNGKEFLFEADKQYLDVSKIYSWIMQNKYNYEYIIAIAETYIKKYESLIKDNKLPKIILSLQTMRNIALNMRKNKLMDTEELELYIESLNHFVDFEFYYLKKGQRLKDREGKIKKKYRNIRDFVIFIKKIDQIINNMDLNYEEEIRETIYEDPERIEPKEELLTDEDYNINYKQFMENYKGRKFETYEEIGREWDGKVTEGDLEAAYLPNKHKKR